MFLSIFYLTLPIPKAERQLRAGLQLQRPQQLPRNTETFITELHARQRKLLYVTLSFSPSLITSALLLLRLLLLLLLLLLLIFKQGFWFTFVLPTSVGSLKFSVAYFELCVLIRWMPCRKFPKWMAKLACLSLFLRRRNVSSPCSISRKLCIFYRRRTNCLSSKYLRYSRNFFIATLKVC